MCVCVCVCVCMWCMHTQPCPTLCDTMEPGKLQSKGFSRQEWWNGLPHPPSGIFGCMCACMCIYTHTHTHILIHIHVSKLKLDVKICTLDYTFYFHKKLVKVNFKPCGSGTSLVAQWVRIRCQCRGHGFYPWPRKIPHDVEQLSLWATTTEPMVHNKRSHWEACALQVGSSPCSLQLEKTHV